VSVTPVPDVVLPAGVTHSSRSKLDDGSVSLPTRYQVPPPVTDETVAVPRALRRPIRSTPVALATQLEFNKLVRAVVPVPLPLVPPAVVIDTGV
jgi:hypothetical protein